MKKIGIIAVALCALPFLFLSLLFVTRIEDEEQKNEGGNYVTVGLSAEVLAYRSLVEKYAGIYNISDSVMYLLAIMQVESGGRGNDVMQSSESAGLPQNTFMPEQSIEQACKYFASLKASAERQECDIYTILQSYNFGGGFIGYVAEKSKNYTPELAEQFSLEKAGGEKVAYTNPVAVQANGGWRYQYGNMFYVHLLKQYFAGGSLADDFGNAIMAEAVKYQGYPYVFGGIAPYSFDCSALTQWCYRVAGVNLPRVAQSQYDVMRRIDLSDAQVGDLVFFHSTYAAGSYITHVGIFAGDGKMFHAGSPLGYVDLFLPYWQQHYVSAGTVR